MFYHLDFFIKIKFVLSSIFLAPRDICTSERPLLEPSVPCFRTEEPGEGEEGSWDHDSYLELQPSGVGGLEAGGQPGPQWVLATVGDLVSFLPLPVGKKRKKMKVDGGMQLTLTPPHPLTGNLALALCTRDTLQTDSHAFPFPHVKWKQWWGHFSCPQI